MARKQQLDARAHAGDGDSAVRELVGMLIVGAPEPAPPWDGTERRVDADGTPSPKDRRSTGHDRRWDASIGRRRGKMDRRKTAWNARWRR